MADGGDSAQPTIGFVVFVFHRSGQSVGDVERAVRRAAPADLALTVRCVPVGADDFAARASAINGGRGSYFSVVEADRWLDDGWLPTALEELRADPTVGIVSVPTSDDRWVVDVDASCFVGRRSAWDAIGGYDIDAVGAHGLSIGWRTWLAGWRAMSVGAPRAPEVVASPALLDRVCGVLLAAPASPHPGGDGHASRRHLQAVRRRPDGELAHLLVAAGSRVTGLRAALERQGAMALLDSRRRVVVATADTLAPTMAGPGIRAWRIAGTLADDHDVILVTTGRCDLSDERFPIEHVDDARFRAIAAGADVLIFQGWVMSGRDWIRDSELVIVADVYDPMHLEQLEQGREAPIDGGRWAAIEGATTTLNDQLRRGDYFLCASPKQRDLWLGQLAALGRVNHVLYDEDNSLTERLRIVPFGVEDRAPVARRRAIRDSTAGIGEDDPVILWGGGIYNWFDPLTLIRAIAMVRRSHPDVRLYFLGTAHPNPEIPEMRMAASSRRLADDLGLTGTHVFFNDGWVPFDERADYLLDADVAVSIHQAHIETEFSFRTRILDYLWCGLPIVATTGDSFEPVIEENRLGATVPPGDVSALADAIVRLLDDPEELARMSERASALASDHRWDQVLEPIREICGAPERAPDGACPETTPTAGSTVAGPRWRRDLDLIRSYLSEGGPELVVRRVRSRVRRLRGRSS